MAALGTEYYREHQGKNILFDKYQSHELFTPYLIPQRPTVLDTRYRQYRELLDKLPQTPWGMGREYGGMNPVSLPETNRPKSEPPLLVQKGHHHYGSGVYPFPRGIPTEQYYDLTLLKRSNIRSNDELVPRPTDVDMTKLQVRQAFPAQHPYFSHQSKFALFPSFSNTPDDPKTGEAAKHSDGPIHPTMPAMPNAVTVEAKTKGSPLRKETVEMTSESHKRALTWPGDRFDQQLKGANFASQQYYPTPPKTVQPNHNARSLDHTLSPRTVNALRNVERSQWITTYAGNYTGYGPANALLIDNYGEKQEREFAYGVEDNTLRPRFYNSFLPPRPLEGRVSRMIGPNQAVRCVIKDGRIHYVPFTMPTVVENEMDKTKEYKSLPSETRDSFQNPAKTEQWKKLEAEKTPEHSLVLIQRKKQEQEPVNQQMFVPERERLKCYPEEYAKELEEQQHRKFEEVAANTRWRQAENRTHFDDLSLLRRKVNYATPIMQPPVYYDTLHQVYNMRAPYYYDGKNPYELDDVSPWEYHKVNSDLDISKMEEEWQKHQDERTKKENEEKAETIAPKAPSVNFQDWNQYQFAGHPGRVTTAVSPKYSAFQLLHGRPRLEYTPSQKPPAQSNYTYSHSYDQIKNVRTPYEERYNLKHMGTAIPQMYPRRPSTAPEPPAPRNVSISDTVQVARGGGSEPLRTTMTRSYPAGNDDILNVSRPPLRFGPGPAERASRAQLRPLPETDPSQIRDFVLREPKNFWPDLNRSVELGHTPVPNGCPTSPHVFWSPPPVFRGQPRPQSRLLNIQNEFTRTDARKNFHNTFRENNPDLRENTARGKQHEFYGENAAVWH